MAESSIATRIAEMSDQKTDIEADIDKYIEDIENKFQIEYAVLQKKAIKTAVQRNFLFLPEDREQEKPLQLKLL
jgi:hypothetical protein